MTLYSSALYLIVLYRIRLHCIVSHCIVWYFIVSYRVVSYRIVLYCVVSCRMALHHIVLCHAVLYRITLYCIRSYCTLLCRVTLHIVVSCRIVSYDLLPTYHQTMRFFWSLHGSQLKKLLDLYFLWRVMLQHLAGRCIYPPQHLNWLSPRGVESPHQSRGSLPVSLRPVCWQKLTHTSEVWKIPLTAEGLPREGINDANIKGRDTPPPPIVTSSSGSSTSVRALLSARFHSTVTGRVLIWN